MVVVVVVVVVIIMVVVVVIVVVAKTKLYWTETQESFNERIAESKKRIAESRTSKLFAQNVFSLAFFFLFLFFFFFFFCF